MFLSDLARHLQVPAQIDFVRLGQLWIGNEIYPETIEITKDVETPLEGKNVIVVEDIIDSGRTLLF